MLQPLVPRHHLRAQRVDRREEKIDGRDADLGVGAVTAGALRGDAELEEALLGDGGGQPAGLTEDDVFWREIGRRRRHGAAMGALLADDQQTREPLPFLLLHEARCGVEHGDGDALGVTCASTSHVGLVSRGRNVRRNGVEVRAQDDPGGRVADEEVVATGFGLHPLYGEAQVVSGQALGFVDRRCFVSGHARCVDQSDQMLHGALELLGVDGCTREYPVERFMRDARVTSIFEGTTEIQKLVIARAISKDV